MSESSSSDNSSYDPEHDHVLSTASPNTPRTSIASPTALTINTSDGPKRSRRNSNVRFRETNPPTTEDEQASSHYLSRDACSHSLGKDECGKSPLRSDDEILQERRLERRMDALENRLENRLHDLEMPRILDFSEKGDGSSERSGLSIEPQWMTWQEYLEPPSRATNIVEVLIEKPHTNTRRRSSVLQTTTDTPNLSEAKNIERIRFRSHHIISALQQITEQTFPNMSCHTILRPFKILLFYRDAIEQYASDLENTFNQATNCILGDRCKMRAYWREPSCKNPFDPQSTEGNQSQGYRNSRQESFDVNSTSLEPLKSGEPVPCGSPSIDCRDTDPPHKQYHRHTSVVEDKQCRHEESEDLLAQREAVIHLHALIKFMREDMRETFERHDLLRSPEAEKISYLDTFHLFMAGDLVVNNDESDQMIYQVCILPAAQTFSSKRPVKEMKMLSDGSHQQIESVYTQEALSVIHIDVFYYGFDGRNFGPVERRITLVSYDGLKNVTDLPIYPLRFHRDADAFKAKMMERGRRFCKLLTERHWEYSGLCASEPQEQIDSQVIIDVPLAYRKHPHLTPKFGLKSWIEDSARVVTEACGVPGCTDCFKEGFMFDDHRIDRQRTVEFLEANKQLLRIIDDVTDLTDDLILLLPNRIFAFVLRSRKWYFLYLDTLRPVRRQSEGFESLILPRGVARLVEGLVQTHGHHDEKQVTRDESTSEHQFDLVRGKGKGLIILLHGAPGVGKTSTAECVADYTQRPLFPITCGDIGETAKEVEQNLERNFSLAHRWGCVLLLDEADVFLQARDKEDMRRNSVVSVFLRVLEYYSGILFLTTNKVGHFDEAFKSRIHVSLYYPQLDEKTTHKIWKMNLKRLMQNQSHIEVDAKAIKRFAKKHYTGLSKAKRGPWNGRQIKNAFQTAIALAEFDARTDAHPRPVLTVEHFEIVAKASEGFDAYLARIHGPDMDRARREGQRDDEQAQAVVFPTPSRRSGRRETSPESSSSEERDDERKKARSERSTRKKQKNKTKHLAKAQIASTDGSTSSSSASSDYSNARRKRRMRREKAANTREAEGRKPHSKAKANDWESHSDETSSE